MANESYRTAWDQSQKAQIALEARSAVRDEIEMKSADKTIRGEDLLNRAATSGTDEYTWTDEKTRDLLDNGFGAIAESIRNKLSDFDSLPDDIPWPSLNKAQIEKFTSDNWNLTWEWGHGIVKKRDVETELMTVSKERQSIEYRLNAALAALRENHKLTRHELDERLLGFDENKARIHAQKMKSDPSYGLDISEVQEYEQMLRRYANREAGLSQFLDTLKKLSEHVSAEYLKNVEGHTGTELAAA